jgi:hypothetical protein
LVDKYNLDGVNLDWGKFFFLGWLNKTSSDMPPFFS